MAHTTIASMAGLRGRIRPVGPIRGQEGAYSGLCGLMRVLTPFGVAHWAYGNVQMYR